MSLEQNGFQFFTDGAARHDVVRALAPHELQIAVGRWFGVEGESHLIGRRWGRELVCELTLQGHNTPDSLQAELDALQARAGLLTGTLTETINGNARPFRDCTFLGFAEGTPMRLDGSGVNGWFLFGRLLWRQRRP